MEVAKRLSIPKGTIGQWVALSKAGGKTAKPGDQSVAELVSENSRLRKELNETQMEREILDKKIRPPLTVQVTQLHSNRPYLNRTRIWR
jgi:transposase-like protein